MVYPVEYTKEILEILKMSLKIRIIELEIVQRYVNEKMRCPLHLSIGQEVNAAAVCNALKFSDKVVSGHRSHAHYLAKGGDISKFIYELHGSRKGCSSGVGGSMHLVDKRVGFEGSTSIVGGTVPIGVGIAKSIKLNKKRNRDISVVFMGEAVTETGVFFESFNFASTQKLPTLFVCENNGYSVYTNLEKRQSYLRENKKVIEGLGGVYFSENSLNPFEIFMKTKKAKEIVRNGKPVFFEIFTHRFYEHCGINIDDSLNYRTKKEIVYWRERDPVNQLFNFVIEKKLVTKYTINKFIKSEHSKIVNIFQKVEKDNYRNLPVPLKLYAE